MAQKVDLYDSAYANYGLDVYREVRIETYCQDFGQTSWVTAEESKEIPELLDVSADTYVLELGCGSGGYALHLAKAVGCRIAGGDINASGVRNANELAMANGLGSKARFEQCDISKKLPYNSNTFDAVFANDVLCHVPGRRGVLREMFRVLKSGGRMLFSDALVIGGMISHEEIATRSSIGFYEYSPPGENERLIEEVGFHDMRVRDTTKNAAGISERWREAREARKADLAAVEGEGNFSGLQRFLSCVHVLTSERRLLRYLYMAGK